jgi:hypothetical protein
MAVVFLEGGPSLIPMPMEPNSIVSPVAEYVNSPVVERKDLQITNAIRC